MGNVPLALTGSLHGHRTLDLLSHAHVTLLYADTTPVVVSSNASVGAQLELLSSTSPLAGAPVVVSTIHGPDGRVLPQLRYHYPYLGLQLVVEAALLHIVLTFSMDAVIFVVWLCQQLFVALPCAVLGIGELVLASSST